MLDFALKLALTPSAVKQGDVESLREAGFDDVGIHDIVQVVALFSYYNRIADGLGLTEEP